MPGLGLGLGLSRGGGVRAAAAPQPSAGAAFSFIAHPDYARSDAANTVPCGDGDSARWIRDAVSGTWVQQATSGARAVLRLGTDGLWGYEFGGSAVYDVTSLLAGFSRNRAGLTLGGVLTRVSDAGGDDRYFTAAVGTGGSTRVALYHQSGTSRTGGRRLDADAFALAVGTATTGWRYLVALVDFTAGTLVLRRGGVQTGTGALASSGGNSSDTDSTSVTIGGVGLSGTIRRLEGFTSVLSGASLTAVESLYATEAK